jgi:4-amino-4-deoxy-L-arabinose transferase-like glycosyltransferase
MGSRVKARLQVLLADRVLVAAMIAGFFLRLVPILLWIDKPCVRDECTYEEIAWAILDGRGMIGTNGWLWAPAYPSLMAVHGALFGYPGAVQLTQLVLAVISILLLYDISESEFDRRTARISAWIYTLSPTLIFYTGTLWSEIIYSTLLLAGVLALRWARKGGAERGWLPGLLAGLCVLFRGVATYMLPIFMLALLWGRHRTRAGWAAALGCMLMAVLTVAPYSAYATNKFGGLVVSDRTLGQMMWLGNNDFPPMTFDWGNGILSKRAYERTLDMGRPHCTFGKDPVAQDACEVEAGKQWIKENPVEFLQRIPERVSQLVTPHSFLTRHLRWSRWRGLPDLVDELLIGAVVVFSFGTLLGGTLGIGARGRGWYAITAALIVLYHVAAIAVLAGLSRYRVPLEPLWMVFAAAAIANPKAAWAGLVAEPRRMFTTIVMTGVLAILMLRFLPAGWPAWGTW